MNITSIKQPQVVIAMNLRGRDAGMEFGCLFEFLRVFYAKLTGGLFAVAMELGRLGVWASGACSQGLVGFEGSALEATGMLQPYWVLAGNKGIYQVGLIFPCSL